MAADLREVFVRDYRVVYQIVGDEVVILTIHHGTRPLWDLSDPDERQLADASGDRREGEGASGAAHGSSEEERGDLVTREQMLYAIRSLPEGAPARDVAYSLETVEAINIAIADVEAGGPTYTQEEIERELAEWQD